MIRREVPKATTDLVVRQGARGLLPAFIEAGHALVDEGAIGITTTCGFLSLMQADLAAALPVPVLTSSLLQVGMINRLLPGGTRAGILTISASTLTEEHLRAADVPKGTPIGSTEEGTEFTKAILSNAPSLDVDAARADLVAAAL
ncbi:MAG: aspartate/glutamate racemase family protein, partial [Pseudomonadota bacterium]